MQKRTLIRLVGSLLLAGATSIAGAQTARQPSAEEIIQSLRGNPAPAAHRGISIESPLVPVQHEAKSIDLEINFEYNSAKLSPDSRFVLDSLATALASDELAASRFRIAGHTDGKGADVYNRKLSQQRAQAVASYLVAKKAVQADRVSVVGLGSSQLLDPANPESPTNRRVQVINLGR